jgi:TPR repeat protein
MPENEVEQDEDEMKRVKKNDPVALAQKGFACIEKGDTKGAFEYLQKAAELGDANAQYNLSVMYREGSDVGVETNAKKRMYYLEEAAIQGHLEARYMLGVEELVECRFERAVKHLTIAANLGFKHAMTTLMKLYGLGKNYVNKDELEATLRANQAALDATKSTQRDIWMKSEERNDKVGTNGMVRRLNRGVEVMDLASALKKNWGNPEQRDAT